MVLKNEEERYHYTTGKGDYTTKHVEDGVKIGLVLFTTNQVLLFL